MIIEGLIIGATIVAMANKENKSKKKLNKIASADTMNYKESKGLTASDGLRISDNITLSSKMSKESVVIISPTGGGKTTRLFYPNLLNNKIKGSFVIGDPKGELYRDTSNYQYHQGRTPIIFSPLNPNISFKYNPLEQCTDITEVSALAETILINGAKSLEIQTGTKAGGIEWIQMGLGLFTASLLYCKEKEYPTNTISNAVRLLINNSTEDLDALFSNCNEDIQEQYNLFKMALDSPKTASSIKVSITNNLRLFLDKNIEEVTKKTEVMAKDLRQSNVAMYISYPEVKSAYLSPLMAIFYSQVITKLMEIEGNDITFMLDEFANIGVINSFGNIISTSRSRGLSFLICLQSISQLESLYGTFNAKTILNNLKTKCVLSGLSDLNTLSYISELSGETEIKVKTSTNNKNSNSTSISSQKKKLFTSDEVRRISDSEILVIAHNRLPILDSATPYFKKKEYLSKINPVDISKLDLSHLSYM